jgi:chromate reductase
VPGDQLTVLAIAGSLRGESFNARLLHRLVELAPPEVVFVDHFLDGLGDLPHFSQELEGERTPASVEALRRRIAVADALLIATPEYNSGMPGVLKNGLDWASRPSGESVLAGKPVAVLGASPGRFGAVRAQAEVRTVLRAIGAEVLDEELPVAAVHEKFGDEGRLEHEETDRALSDLLGSLVELAGGPPPAEPDSAAYSRACQRLAAGS